MGLWREAAHLAEPLSHRPLHDLAVVLRGAASECDLETGLGVHEHVHEEAEDVAAVPEAQVRAVDVVVLARYNVKTVARTGSFV